MKKTFAFLLMLLTSSCAQWFYPQKGNTDEERLYHRVKYQLEKEQFGIAHKTIIEFEKEYPDSPFLCELTELKGDIRQRYSYKDLAIKDYEQALILCREFQENERIISVQEKIEVLKK